ncbi:MAG: sulfatase-like hydrolase/transferase [Gammaproteobacteria bacterium]|nr:sulfatase-like hydrolase/transferase [Gammaproteobacteria bacterium]
MDANKLTASKPGSKRHEALLIAVLFGLAVAEPLFSLLGDNAEFFVAYRFDAAEMVVFAALLSIGLPLLVIAVLLAAGKIHSGAGKTVSVTVQFVLWWLIWLPVASRLGLSGPVNVGISAASGIACVAAWYRFYPVRLLLFYLSPAILLFPLFFLFVSRASDIVVPGKIDPSVEIAGSSVNSDIVFIVFDEFPLVSLLTPELEIDGDRYPNFKRLAGTSTWYRNATTPSEITTGALPAALSGLDPLSARGLLPIHANFPRNIFNLLSETHEVTAWETASLLCPEAFCKNAATDIGGGPRSRAFVFDLAVIYAQIVTPRPYSGRLPPVSHAWSDFLADSEPPVPTEPTVILDEEALSSEVRKREKPLHRGAKFEAFVDRIRKGVKPGLYFLHSMLPHAPWDFQPNGKKYITAGHLKHFGLRPEDDPSGTYSHEWYPDRFAVNQARQKHLLQIQYVDALLGQLLDRLDSQGLFENTLLILASDHGSSFIPGHSRRSVYDTTMSNIASIPFFIKYPGQKTGSTDDSPASLMDILPTLIDVFDLNPGWTLSGHKLSGKARHKQLGDIQILAANGRKYEFQRDVYNEHLKDSARELARIFGTGSESSLFHFGPEPQLVGRTPSDFLGRTAASGRIITDAAWLLRNIDLDATFFPLQVWGRWVDSPAEPLPKQVAVVINGIIQGTTQTYRISGYQDYFSAVIPGDVLTTGRNQLQFFSIDTQGGDPVLREIAQSANALPRLVRSGPDEELRLQTGETFTVQAGSGVGKLTTHVKADQALAMLTGSLPRDTDRESVILVLSNGISMWFKSLSEVALKESASTTDGAIHFNLPMDYYGEIPSRSIQLRVFVLNRTESTARELDYPADCSPNWIFAPPASWSTLDCDE